MRCAKLLQSLCDPMDCSQPGSSVHGIAISSSRDLPDPEMEPASLTSPALAGGFFTASTAWEAPVRSLQRQTSLRIKEEIKIHESVDLSSPVEDGDRIALGKV
ncbi:unnamed protein product [Rangifer tarandus platyrhynchus]|uniref:Uncharacterized protein n=1 Tax=Rangifer tarandus platyrhynchus TaxID=3082113 RepID=A0ABN9A4X0_RANTA|nr:unnamed protein product [Rangifer tarandus platyrhynchus]